MYTRCVILYFSYILFLHKITKPYVKKDARKHQKDNQMGNNCRMNSAKLETLNRRNGSSSN